MKASRDKVRRFLKQCRMSHDDIDMGQLCEDFHGEMRNGLAGQASSLAMIPTYIEVGKDVPTDEPVIVLDAGGTNFRVAAVHFDGSGKAAVENLIQKPMPGLERNTSKDEFFAAIVEYMARVADVSDRIGFCFSYPTEILPGKDGRLVRFCKEVKAKEVEGELIGENLLAAMARAGCKAHKAVVILNDTVATLLAGVNCCYVESNRSISKLSGLDGAGEQIVNVESGAFAKAPRGTIDIQLDESTLDPGQYTFEKMFSGAYLGPLCLKALQEGARRGLLSKAVTEKMLAAEDLQTKDVNDFLRSAHGRSSLTAICAAGTVQDRPVVWHVLDGLIERAAKLVAALLSAVVLKTGKGENPCMPVCITAEGTTFYELKGLKEGVERYLKDLLQDKHGRYFEIVNVDNATLIGAAIAGLTN
ncbi:MAG: hexokinase family protein [Planctomycetota bacterium]|jgi:hexokinase